MNNEEKILQILTVMQADISGLKTDVADLKTGLDAANRRIDDLRLEMRSNFDAVRARMNEHAKNLEQVRVVTYGTMDMLEREVDKLIKKAQ